MGVQPLVAVQTVSPVKGSLEDDEGARRHRDTTGRGGDIRAEASGGASE